MEGLIKKMYTDVNSPYAFGGVDRVYVGLRDKGYKVTKNYIRNVLKSIQTYTLHKPARKKFPRRPVMSAKPGLYFNCDLIELGVLHKNKNSSIS